jgi:hypothetical protein
MLDTWTYLPFSLVIIVAAVGLCVWHIRSWGALRRAALDPAEFDFRRRQFRRRIQASAMLGLLGVAVLGGGVMMSLRLNPLALTLYWLAVILVLGWLALLAVADMVASNLYYRRLHNRYAVEQAQLNAELRRLRGLDGNGHRRPDGGPPQN